MRDSLAPGPVGLPSLLLAAASGAQDPAIKPLPPEQAAAGGEKGTA